MNSRLQFRHHSPIFETRDAAIEYIQRGISEGLAEEDKFLGFSLYGEPTVVRYKNEENEADPYVILAIGSDTNETTQYSYNKYCVIDPHKTETEIEELGDELEAAIKSLTILTKDTNTLKLYAEKTEDGTIVSGDVVVAESKAFGNIIRPNIILSEKEGLFAYVDLDIDQETGKVEFTVNGETKKWTIENKYLVKGVYDKKDESLHLTMNDGEVIVVNFEDLVNEWTVEGEASNTPIVLTKEEIGYGDGDGHYHSEPWQDVLKADVRIADDQRYNILEKTKDGRYLYVKGTADNIKCLSNGEVITVQDAIDACSEKKVSSDYSNIIYEKYDGYFANVDFSYDNKTNTLEFKKSNVSGGTTTKSITLNSVKLFEDIRYDATKEQLVIYYTDQKGEMQIVEVPLGEMMSDWEWDIQNEGHNVKLHKARVVNGNDKVSADVAIYRDEDNILVDKNHELFVKGTADNIKFGDSTVEDALTKLVKRKDEIDSELEGINSNVSDINDKLEQEIQRAIRIEASLDTKIEDEIKRSKEADNAHENDIDELKATIGDGFTSNSYENVTTKFNELSGYADSISAKTETLDGALQELSGKTDNEIERAIASENRIEQKFDDELGEGFDIRNTVRDEFNKEKQERIDNDATLSGLVETLSANTESRLIDLTSDISINVDKADPVRPNIKVNISQEVEDDKVNLIKLNADGLYVGVDLKYDYVKETGKSMLIFKTTNGTKNIDIQPATFIDHVTYDPTTESLVIWYFAGGEMQKIEVPLGDLLDEWRVSEDTRGAIKLDKQRDESFGKDVLYGEVILNTNRGDNILENLSGSLYVSNSGITQNANDIQQLKDKKLDGITTDSSLLVDDAHSSTGLTPDLKINLDETGNNYINLDIVDPSTPFGNILTVTKDGLYATIDVEYQSGVDKNTIIFKTINGSKSIDIVSNTNIQEFKYNRETENLELKFIVNGVEETKFCNVSELIEEWNVSNPEGNAIVLTKNRNNASDGNVGPDLLSADVKISEAPNNILTKLGGGGALFVDGSQITANADAIEKSKGEISGLTERVGTLETNMTEVQNGLKSEIDRATAREEQLEKWISDERDARQAADTENKAEISGLNDRVGVLESNMTDVQNGLKNEVDRATSKETQLENWIVDERNARIAGDADNKAEISGLNDRVGVLESDMSHVQSGLDSEIGRATAKETQLEGWINEERNARKEADDKLQIDVNTLKSALDNEKEDRANADRQLRSDIEAEANRANQAENSLAQDIRDEATNRQAADSVLEAKIATEADNRKNADDAIEKLITAEETRATARENEIENTLNTKIVDEITRATAADNELKEKINEADSRLTKGLSDETLRASLAEKDLSEKLTEEITRSTSKDEALENALKDEISRSKEVEKGLTDKINAIDFVFDDTKTIDLNRATDGTPNVITANLIISNSDKNIIVTENDKHGVFATVSMEYDEATNSLKLIGPNGMELSNQKLGPGSLINRIEYDADEKDLIIYYTSAGSNREEYVHVGVTDLFNEWDVKNLTQGSALELTKIPNTTESGKVDLIQGRVLIAGEYNEDGSFDYGDNIIRIVGNGLYASGAGIEEAIEKTDCVSKELKTVESAIFGSYVGQECGEGFTYTPNINSKYIKTSTSITQSIEVLDEKIYNVSGDVANLSEDADCLKKEFGVAEKIIGIQIPECGMNGDGTLFTYTPNENTCYISGATSLNNADVKLDNAVCDLRDELEKTNANVSCTKKELSLVEGLLGATVSGNCETDTLGVVYPKTAGCLLSSETIDSFAAADAALEAGICALRNMLVGSKTASATLSIVEEGLNAYPVVDVRLSHGNYQGLTQDGTEVKDEVSRRQTDDDLYIRNFRGDVIEPGYSEFTDTNVLRIVDLTTMGDESRLPDHYANGMYLSNIWDCGLYTKDGEGTPYEEYRTDESSLAENLFEQNYRNGVRYENGTMRPAEPQLIFENGRPKPNPNFKKND